MYNIIMFYTSSTQNGYYMANAYYIKITNARQDYNK